MLVLTTTTARCRHGLSWAPSVFYPLPFRLCLRTKRNRGGPQVIQLSGASTTLFFVVGESQQHLLPFFYKYVPGMGERSYKNCGMIRFSAIKKYIIKLTVPPEPDSYFAKTHTHTHRANRTDLGLVECSPLSQLSPTVGV